MSTIEQLKLNLIKQATDEAKVEYDLLTSTLDEVIERVFHFAFDIGYDKGYDDCARELENELP
jgi:hypothetical protein